MVTQASIGRPFFATTRRTTRVHFNYLITQSVLHYRPQIKRVKYAT